MEIKKEVVRAKPRRLKATWTIEKAHEIHMTDKEWEEIAQEVQKELAKERYDDAMEPFRTDN